VAKLYPKDSRNKSSENYETEKSERLGILFCSGNAIIKPSSDLTTPHKKSKRKKENSHQNVRIISSILNFARHLKIASPRLPIATLKICQKGFAVPPLKIIGPKK